MKYLSLRVFTPLKIKQQKSCSLHKCRRHLLSLMGFTLIEVLVATLVLAVVIAGIFTVFISGERGLMLDKLKSQALIYAQQTLEELASKDFYNDVLNEGVHNYPLPAGELKDKHSGQRSYNVNYIWDGDDLKFKQIVVTINWSYLEKNYTQILEDKISSPLIRIVAEGTVRDQTTALPIEGAWVQATSQNYPPQYTAQDETDFLGSYRLTEVKAKLNDAITLTCSKPGYQTEQTIQQVIDKTISYDFVLVPSP